MKTKLIALISLTLFLGLKQELKAVEAKGYITGVATDHAGKYIATAGANGKVNIWNIETSLVMKEIWFYGMSNINAIAISPDDKFIAIAVGGGGTYVYTFPEGKIVKKLKDAGSSNLIYLPDGTLATVSYEGETQVWDVAAAKLVKVFKSGHAIYSPLAVSPDGKLLLTAAPKEKFKLFDLTGAGTEEIFKGKSGTMPMEFAFSHDSKLFAVAGASGDNSITVYDVSTKSVVRVIERSGNKNSIVFSADDQTLYIGGYKTIDAVAISSGTKQVLHSHHFALVNSLALSADGTTLMSGSDDLCAVVYVIPNNYLKRRLMHQDPEPKALEHGIGAKFGGGLVVDSYRTGDGAEHGLIMAFQSLPGVMWCDQQGLTGAVSSEGFGNTEMIIGSKGTHAHAAGLSREFHEGEFTDWYLPSLDECKRVFANIGAMNWPFVFWTSTEESEDRGYGFDFRTGQSVPQKKSQACKIRCVRAF